MSNNSKGTEQEQQSQIQCLEEIRITQAMVIQTYNIFNNTVAPIDKLIRITGYGTSLNAVVSDSRIKIADPEQLFNISRSQLLILTSQLQEVDNDLIKRIEDDFYKWYSGISWNSNSVTPREILSLINELGSIVSKKQTDLMNDTRTYDSNISFNQETVLRNFANIQPHLNRSYEIERIYVSTDTKKISNNVLYQGNNNEGKKKFESIPKGNNGLFDNDPR